MDGNEQPKKPFKINDLYAIIHIDPDGTEGIVSYKSKDGTWVPMIAVDLETAKKFIPMVQKLETDMEANIKVIRFTQRVDITSEVNQRIIRP